MCYYVLSRYAISNDVSTLTSAYPTYLFINLLYIYTNHQVLTIPTNFVVMVANFQECLIVYLSNIEAYSISLKYKFFK